MNTKTNIYRDSSSREGFTLIELLTVIGIIVLLISVAGVAANQAFKKANETRTVVQFNNWAAAFEAYKAEYGVYPSDFNKSSEVELNKNKDSFYFALVGRDEKGGELSSSERKKYNRKALSFLEVSQKELNDDGDFVDAFGNTEIFIKVDHDNDGIIKGLPLDDEGKKGDVRMRVAIYTDSDEFTKVRNWE